MSSVKISRVKRIVYLRAKIKFCPCILHFSSEHKFHETSQNESHAVFTGINEFKSIPSITVVPIPMTGLEEQRITVEPRSIIFQGDGENKR